MLPVEFDALVGQVSSWSCAEPRSVERRIHDRSVARAQGLEQLLLYAVEESVLAGVTPGEGSVIPAERWFADVLPIPFVVQLSDCWVMVLRGSPIWK